MTRIEIWLGGPEAPDPLWIKRVQDVFAKEARIEKVFNYQAFASGGGKGGNSVSRSGSGTLGGGGRGGGNGGQIPVMGRFGSQGSGNGLMPAPTAFKGIGMARSQSLGA